MDESLKRKSEKQKQIRFNIFDEEILDIPTFLRRNAD
jgi:cell division protein FtsZ